MCSKPVEIRVFVLRFKTLSALDLTGEFQVGKEYCCNVKSDGLKRQVLIPALCRMGNLHFPMVQIMISFPNIPSPKTRSVDLFCFIMLMFTSM